MLLELLPNINKVFSLVIQQERELNLSLDSKILLAKGSRPAGFTAGSQNLSQDSSASSQNFSQGSFAGSKPSNTKHCTFCNKPRHTEETCYRKHGFPPGFKFR